VEIADIKRRVVETIERAKRRAAARRIRNDEAAREYDTFLAERAIPVFKQVANVLRAEGFAFTVFTPGGSVRLMSDRSADEYVEVSLDTSDDQPAVTGQTRRARGRRVIEQERQLGAPAALGEEHVLKFLLEGLEPLVER
jgi:hypothetical protein